MSRETKFRAWLKEYQKMVQVIDLDFEFQQIGIDDFTSEEYGRYLFIYFSNIELMQYTGLKDKNGVEIYDGYIVRDDRKRIFVIEYKFGGFNIVPIDCYNDEFSWNPLGDMQTAGWLNESVEVIGNIYENPELLKKEI